jgi:hypothetical protein
LGTSRTLIDEAIVAAARKRSASAAQVARDPVGVAPSAPTPSDRGCFLGSASGASTVANVAVRGKYGHWEVRLDTRDRSSGARSIPVGTAA